MRLTSIRCVVKGCFRVGASHARPLQESVPVIPILVKTPSFVMRAKIAKMWSQGNSGYLGGTDTCLQLISRENVRLRKPLEKVSAHSALWAVADSPEVIGRRYELRLYSMAEEIAL